MRSMDYLSPSFLFATLLCVLSAGAMGCQGQRPSGTPPESTATPAVQATPGDHPEGLPEADRTQVIARIGDTVITLGEFEERLQSQSLYAQAAIASPQRRREFLENMIQMEVLAAEAKRMGYDKDPDVIQAKNQTMVRKLMTNEIQEMVKLTDITEDEMKRYYEDNLADYQKPEQARASHLLVADRQEAETLRQQMLTELKENPTGFRRIFADLARSHSLDEATKARGGDLRFFAREPDSSSSDDHPAAQLVEAAFSLETAGDISEPLQTEHGWHLVMLTGRRNPYERTFDQVMRQIQNRLYRDRKKEATDAYLANLKGQANIVKNEALLANLESADTAANGQQEEGEADGAPSPATAATPSSPKRP